MPSRFLSRFSRHLRHLVLTGLCGALAAHAFASSVPQSIDFPPIANPVDGDAPLTLTATASSGLPVSFDIVSGFAGWDYENGVFRLRLDHPGEVVVMARQEGDGTYLAAEPVQRSFTILPGARPANDDFAAAKLLSGNSGSVTGTNRFATGEPGEPDYEYYFPPMRSVWWRWIAPAGGRASFDNRGSTLNCSLEIFAEDDSGALVSIKNAVGGGAEAESATFDIVEGDTYHIRVSGAESETGDIRLNWDLLSFLKLKQADRVTSQGFTASWNGNARSYRLEIFSPASGPEETPRFIFALGDVRSHVVRGLSPSTSYACRIIAVGAGDLALASEPISFTTLPSEKTPPANDSVLGAIELAPAGGSVSGDNRGATSEAFEAPTPNASVWYRWTAGTTGLWRFGLDAPFAATLDLYLADDSVTHSDSPPLASASGGFALEWETQAGVSYLVRISSPGADQGPFTLSWNLASAASPPANDAFADAAILSEANLSVVGDNRFAGVELGEPDPRIGSLWWRWTATRDDYVFLSKTSDFSSRLTVFRGTSLDSLEEVGFSEFDAPRHFEAEAGATYYLRIDGSDGHGLPRGAVRLDLRLVARPVLAPPSAIGETGFTAAWSGTTGTCILRLYDSQDTDYVAEQVIEVAAGRSEHVVTGLRPGTSYHYTIAKKEAVHVASQPGEVTTLPASGDAPENDAIHQAIILAPEGGSLTASNRYASNEVGESHDLPGNEGAYSSLWYSWTAPSDGEWRFDLAGSAVPAAIAIYEDGYSVTELGFALATVSSGEAPAACLFAARAGKTYRIALLGQTSSRGDLAFAWSLVLPLSPPINDDLEHALALESPSGSVPITLDLATSDQYGPYFSWWPSVWFKWQAPANTRVRFTFDGITPRTFVDVFTSSWPGNLDYVSTLSFYIASPETVIKEWNAQAGEVYYLRIADRGRLPADASLAWTTNFESPAPAVVTRGARFITLRLPDVSTQVYGPRLLVVSTHPDLQEPVYRREIFNENGDRVIDGLRPSTRYYFALSELFYPHELPPANVGMVDTAADEAPSPVNSVSRPIALPASGTTVKGSTNASSLESANMQASVWYSFTPRRSGIWTTRLVGEGFDPQFIIFESPAGQDARRPVIYSAFDPVRMEVFAASRIVERAVPLRAGTRYLIAVSGLDQSRGSFSLALKLLSPLTPPENDHFASASAISGRTGLVPANLRLASIESAEKALHTETDYTPPDSSVWWRWTAPVSARMRFHMADVGGYPSLDAFTGHGLSTLRLESRGSSYGSTDGAFVIFDAIAGSTYWIRGGASYLAGGLSTLSWAPATEGMSQYVDLLEPTPVVPGQTTIRLAAIASSGLPVTYQVLHGSATIDGDILHLNGSDRVRVRAVQPGDDFFAPGFSREIDIQLPVTTQQISFPWPGDRYLGSGPGLLLASSSAGLPIEFEIVSGPATVSGNALSVTGLGKVVVRAKQPGDATNAAAEPIEHTFTVLRGPASPITLSRSIRVYSGVPQSMTAITVPAGLNVVYTYASDRHPPSSMPPVDVGTYTVTARIDDPSVTAKAIVTSTLVIKKAPLTATGPDRSRFVGQPNPDLSAISYSGFVNGDGPASLDRPPVASTKATATSTAGVYPITLAGGSDKNYAFTLAPGSLQVLGFGGTYEALLRNADGIPHGKLSLTLPPNSLAFSGVLILASEGEPISIRGFLAASAGQHPAASGAWQRKGHADSALALSVRIEGHTLAATLLRGGETYLSAESRDGGLLSVAHGQNTSSRPDAYTLVLRDPLPLDDEDLRPLPRGDGYASGSLNASGALSIKGRLSDGTPFSTSLRHDVTGRYHLFARPYFARAESFLSGVFKTETHPDQTRFPGRVHVPDGDAILVWCKTALPAETKPAARDKTCRQGFAVDAVLLLDPWLPPIRNTPLANRLGLPADEHGSAPFSIAYDPYLDLGASGGELPSTALLRRNNRVSAGESSTPWTISIDPASGVFTGSLQLTDIVATPTPEDVEAMQPFRRKVSFRGVLRQANDHESLIGYGHLLLPAPSNEETSEQTSGTLRFAAP